MSVSYTPGQHEDRPWGRWEILAVGIGYAVKRIVVRPGGRLSLQRHTHRAEHWIIVGGEARVTRQGSVFALPAGGTVAIATGDVHRIENLGAADLVFIEVQRGEHLREDDIERLEDDYGRP